MLGMKDYLFKRGLQSIFTIFVTITINFLLFRVMPGNPMRILYSDPRVRADTINALVDKFGLSKPMHEQYLIYVKETIQGNLGVSFVYQQPVFKIIAPRLMNTLLLVACALIVSTVVGTLIGIYTAWKRGSLFDVTMTSLSLLTYAMPLFLSSLVLAVVFGYYLEWFPLTGMRSIITTLSPIVDVTWHMILPMGALIIWYLGGYALIMRNNMMDVLTEDYIVTAEAKGLKNREILLRHAARNALLPTVTLMAMNFGFIAAGSIQVETVFAWPGIGRLMYQSLAMRDYPVLQGAFFVVTIWVVISNFFSDLLYYFLDPRVRY